MAKIGQILRFSDGENTKLTKLCTHLVTSNKWKKITQNVSVDHGGWVYPRHGCNSCILLLSWSILRKGLTHLLDSINHPSLWYLVCKHVSQPHPITSYYISSLGRINLTMLLSWCIWRLGWDLVNRLTSPRWRHHSSLILWSKVILLWSTLQISLHKKKHIFRIKDFSSTPKMVMKLQKSTS